MIGAGVLSMLSALRANLLAASRVAFSMARDRTLPRRLGRMRGRSGAPAMAVAVTGVMVATIALVVGEVAAAGAASSLIFLITFAMVHWAAVLARHRTEGARPGALPLIGAALCLGLAAFQAYAVPEAGAVVVSWLAVGVALYLVLLAPGARLVDVAAEARDPDLAQLRGRSPLVLVPIANPARAASLASVAATIRTPGVGRILFLSVVRAGGEALDDRGVGAAREPPRPRRRPRRPRRVAPVQPRDRALGGDAVHHRPRPLGGDRSCGGRARLRDRAPGAPRPRRTGPRGAARGVDRPARGRRGDRPGAYRWRMEEGARVLVPIRGRRDHSHLRARLLASLSRTGARAVTVLRIAPPDSEPEDRRRLEREVRRLAREEATGPFEVAVEYTDRRDEAIVRHAAAADLVVMGTLRRGRRWQGFGDLVRAIATETEVPLVLIGRRT